MKKFLSVLVFALCILSIDFCVANAYYDTLENGNLVLVDGHHGVGRYAVRSSVQVGRYNPPYYQISIEVLDVPFSADMKNYSYGDRKRYYFRYNWNTKNISYLSSNNNWIDWSLNRDYTHGEGDPFVPNTAEVAFVSAYNMRFFNGTQKYSPHFKKYERVISEEFYRALRV